MAQHRFILVPGVLDRDGSKTVATLVPRLKERGHEVTIIPLWMTGIITALLSKRLLGATIASLLPRSCVLIGHSHGCRLILEAVKRGASPKAIILVNPAVPSNYAWPKNLKNALVWYVPTDLVVLLSGLMPTWGWMGRVGWRDKRAWNLRVVWARSHTDAFSHASRLVDTSLLWLAILGRSWAK